MEDDEIYLGNKGTKEGISKETQEYRTHLGDLR
jgi:hypothetical protein